MNKNAYVVLICFFICLQMNVDEIALSLTLPSSPAVFYLVFRCRIFFQHFRLL